MKRILVILLALLLLAGCGNTTTNTYTSSVAPTAELTQISNIKDYTIIMPTDRDDAVKEAVMALRDALGKVIGDTMPFSTDKKESTDEAYEILVGATTRAQSNLGLKYDDYTVKLDGNKIVIAGGSYSATVEAVDWFIQKCVDKTVSVPSTPYEVKRDYSFETLKINSVALKDYAVVLTAKLTLILCLKP